MNNKLFEVPYNFNESLLPFYKKFESYISFLYLPPYKEDSINTRTSIETNKKGCCYMPKSREEYEYHLHKIISFDLRFVVLWQAPNSVIPLKILDYYNNLGAIGFIVANDKSAKIIKAYNPNLIVICSVVQRVCSSFLKKDLQYYDYVVLYFSINRSLNTLKQLSNFKNKIIIIPNTLCHIDCSAIHHWFPTKDRPFIQDRDCLVIKNNETYSERCGFISPNHLYLFDDYVGGYKLQGREYTTTMIKYLCKMYFNRNSPDVFLRTILGDDLSSSLLTLLMHMPPEQYYNAHRIELINNTLQLETLF